MYMQAGRQGTESGEIECSTVQIPGKWNLARDMLGLYDMCRVVRSAVKSSVTQQEDVCPRESLTRSVFLVSSDQEHETAT